MFNERLICEYLVNSCKLYLIVSRFTDRLKHKNNCAGFYKYLLISGTKILALCKNKNMLWFFRIKEQCRGNGNQASSLTQELYDLTSFGFEGHVEFT